jgi:uncharacterized lipoprotein YbaY
MRIFALAFLFLSGCTANAVESPTSNAPIIENQMEKLPILIKFADEARFPDNSYLLVQLYDGGLMDTSIQPIGKFEDHNYGERGIITGHIEYSQKDFERLSMPSFSARLEQDGRLIAINKSSQPFQKNKMAQTIIIDKVQ